MHCTALGIFVFVFGCLISPLTGGVPKRESWRCLVKVVMTSPLQEAFLSHRGHIYGYLGAILARLGGVLGASWSCVGPSWGHSGACKWGFRSRGVQQIGSRRCEVRVVMTSPLQETFLSHRGHIHGHPGAILARLGGILARHGAILGPLGGLKMLFSFGGCATNGKLTM